MIVIRLTPPHQKLKERAEMQGAAARSRDDSDFAESRKMAGRLNTAAREAAQPQTVSQKWSITSNPFPSLDPVYLALSRLRRRRFDDSLTVSTEILSNTPLDQQVGVFFCNGYAKFTSLMCRRIVAGP